VVAVVVVDVAVVVVAVVVVVVVAVAVVIVTVVFVAVVVVVEVHSSHRPGQLCAAASRMYWFGFSQFLRRNPGTKQPIGSGTPLQDGSEHVLQVIGHWIRAASAGLPSASQRASSISQAGESGSPLQLGVVVVAVAVVVVFVNVEVVEVLVIEVVVLVIEVVVVDVLMQVLQSAGHAILS